MSAAVHTDSNKNKAKPKQRMFSVFNRIKSAVAPKQQMLTTDAAPIDDSQIPSNAVQLRDENLPSQLRVPDRNAQIERAFPMQMAQNHVNQLNQNATMIGTQQNLSFNNCDKLHIGTNIYHGQRRSSSRKNSYNGNNENRPKKMSKTVTEMTKCNEPIDMSIMRIASKFMDKDWRMVFRDLGISDPEINQITQQYINTTSVKEIIYQLLLLWERNSDDPTLGKLTKILWENEHFKCVDELKMLYKQRRPQAETNPSADTPVTDTHGKNLSCNGES